MKSCNVANFVDLDAITAGMDGEEALKPRRDGGGCPEFDFLLVDKEKADIFELVVWVITYMMGPKSCTKRDFPTERKA